MKHETNNYSKTALRELLQRIRQQPDSMPSSGAAFELALQMMEHLGDPDPVLRDELIYGTLRDWIMQGMFHAQQLRRLLSIALDDRHLFYRIGEERTDSVFMRSFSVLVIPPIMWTDRKSPFLEATEIRTIINKLLTYLNQERDLRGYAGEKGWAHAAAHAADAVEDVVQSNDVRREDLSDFMEAFKTQLRQTRYTFIHEEDERIVSAVVTLWSRNLLEDKEIRRWITDLGDTPKVGEPSMDLIKNVLRSFYFFDSCPTRR